MGYNPFLSRKAVVRCSLSQGLPRRFNHGKFRGGACELKSNYFGKIVIHATQARCPHTTLNCGKTMSIPF